MKSNFIFIKALPIIVLSVISLTTSAQFEFEDVFEEEQGKDTLRFYEIIDVEDFKTDLFNEILLNNINSVRNKLGLDSIVINGILRNCAEDQSEYMATNEEAIEFQSGKKKTTRSRLIYYGGSGVGAELIKKMSVKNGTGYFTYKDLADELFFKWMNSKKTKTVIEDPAWIFIGMGSSLDYDGKKAYISAVFGNYLSFNEGADRRDELDVPFTKKKHGLKPAEPKACKKCKKFKNIEKLQKGLYVKDNNIYFKYDNLKALKKIMRGPKDGIAVDVVRKIQYPCVGANIVDNTNPIKGIPTKKLWSKKMFKKNLITDKKERKKHIDVLIGKFPKKLTGLSPDEYELNLMIIQNKHICRNIHPYFDLTGDVEYSNPIDLLADTITTGNTDYIPEATSTTLSFKIPFEQAKYNYNKEDIEPFLNALNEPEFVIDELTIHAYSSIEGTEQQNEMLQKKRAESIISALNSRQKSIIKKTNIITGENWDDFVRDISGTEYENMASMNIKQAQAYIKDNGLAGKLEKILKNHRYATLEMKITYDIEGDKEQEYVVKMFNNAINDYDRVKALAIQKYIFKKVVAGEYDAKAVSGMNIPETSSNAGLLMNKLWLEKYVQNDDISEECCKKVDNLYQLDPSNIYIRYNQLYCNFVHEKNMDANKIEEIQKTIDAMYETALSKETVDLLNLEYQFTVLEVINEMDKKPEKLFEETLNRIKEIVNLEESNWQNSLKLAYIFMRQEDFEFAAELLEPFVQKRVVFEELVYLYLSLCSRSPERISSNKFVSATRRAYKLNPERYCKLFDGSKFSIQVLENTIVKEHYCKVCKQ